MAGVSLTFDIFGRDRTASKALRGVGSEADKTHGKLGKFGSAGKFAGLAVAGGIGLAAAGFAAAVPIIGSAVKAAADDEAAQKRLATTLRNTTGARAADVAGVEAWISKQGVALGVTDDELRPALGRLVRSTKDVGEAQKLAALAMDVSKGSGKSLETVSNALGRAYDGNTGALGRLGVKTKDAQGNALSFDQITKNLSATFKGQASSAANTYQGKMDRLKLVFNETKESVGSNLLPALSNLGGWFLDKGIPAIGRMANQIMPTLRKTFDSVKKTVEDNRPGLEQLGRILGAVGGFILTKVIPAFIKWQGIVTKVVITALAKLGEVLPPIVAGMLRGVATIIGGFRGLVTAALSTFGAILTAAEKGMGWIPGIGPKIKQAKAGFDSFKKDAVDKLKSVENGLKTAANSVDSFGRKAKAIPEAKLKADIKDLESKIKTAKNELNNKDLTKDRKAALKASISDLQSKVDQAKRKLAEVKGKTVYVNVKVTTYGGAQGIRGADGRWTPLWKITPMAEGGIVKGGRGGLLALIGEGRHDEAVVPLPRGGSGSVGMGDTYNITVNGAFDPAGTAEQIRSMLLDLKRKRGYQLGIA